MASNTILEQLREEANESKMVGLIKELLAATTQAAKTALAEKLGTEPTASCKINREIDAFAFKEPRRSLDEWLTQLRKNSQFEPINGIHWKAEHKAFTT